MFSADFIQKLIVSLPSILIALTVHEVAHGWTASKLGDPTARNMGRLSLNPMVHLDPVGTLAFVISLAAGIGFGWAKPVPVDTTNLKNPRKDMVWVALAGPVSNFFLAILSLFVLLGMQHFGIHLSFVGEPIYKMLHMSFIVNTALAAFNLVPILPFDGGRILHGLLPRRLAFNYSRLEPYGFYIILVLIFLNKLTVIMSPIFYFLLATEQIFAMNLFKILSWF